VGAEAAQSPTGRSRAQVQLTLLTDEKKSGDRSSEREVDRQAYNKGRHQNDRRFTTANHLTQMTAVAPQQICSERGAEPPAHHKMAGKLSHHASFGFRRAHLAIPLVIIDDGTAVIVKGSGRPPAALEGVRVRDVPSGLATK
jgi:hypothetical protein